MGANGPTLHLDEKTFASETSSGVALIDFWAPWCPPCVALAPTIDRLAEEYQGRAKIAKVNVDEAPSLGARYNVRSIPAVLFLKDGEEVGRVVGLRPREQLAAELDRFLDE